MKTRWLTTEQLSVLVGPKSRLADLIHSRDGRDPSILWSSSPFLLRSKFQAKPGFTRWAPASAEPAGRLPSHSCYYVIGVVESNRQWWSAGSGDSPVGTGSDRTGPRTPGSALTSRRWFGQPVGPPETGPVKRGTLYPVNSFGVILRVSFAVERIFWGVGHMALNLTCLNLPKLVRRGDNSWYLVYKRPWYPVDILDILLLDSVKTRLFSAIFQVFHSLTTVHWYLAYI